MIIDLLRCMHGTLYQLKYLLSHPKLLQWWKTLLQLDPETLNFFAIYRFNRRRLAFDHVHSSQSVSAFFRNFHYSAWQVAKWTRCLATGMRHGCAYILISFINRSGSGLMCESGHSAARRTSLIVTLQRGTEAGRCSVNSTQAFFSAEMNTHPIPLWRNISIH